MQNVPSTPDILKTLSQRGQTLAFAESLTGGLLCDEFISVAGASAVVRGGVVAYATDVKARVLGVDQALLDSSGPVDPDVARQMAQGARTALGATFGLSTTGVAGPEPQGHPVGTVYIGVATQTHAVHRLLHLDGDRTQIRTLTVAAAVELLSEIVGLGTPEEQS